MIQSAVFQLAPPAMVITMVFYMVRVMVGRVAGEEGAADVLGRARAMPVDGNAKLRVDVVHAV